MPETGLPSILALHGPNLNLLGLREPKIYGRITLAEIDQRLAVRAQELGYLIRSYQSNSEGALVDALHEARSWASGVVMNSAAYTHTSIAIRDAIAATGLAVVEVHLSNIFARESFRHQSLVAPVCIGSVSGFGWRSYLLGLQALVDYLADRQQAGN